MIDKTQVPTFVINCSTLLNAYEVRALERQLIKEHIEAHGQKPVGNVKDEEHMD